jgi:integrase
LRMILLCGQRPGETKAMRHDHIKDGWWEMPGKPEGDWPGTKNGASHRVWLSAPARAILIELGGESPPTSGLVFEGCPRLTRPMADACSKLGVERATPHDLRRTFSTTVTGLGFGRDALNRVTNHREGGIADVYDRHRYTEENMRIMEAVAAHILALAEGRVDATVLPFFQIR